MEMKDRFRIICYRLRGGNYYIHDNQTGERESLHTTDPKRASELLRLDSLYTSECHQGALESLKIKI
ncbi:MAG: hypothetical protein KGJ60_01325 [Verrucomicrobiota bacterium]|nr:hypothetical protein [Verrucomicrobiota bacterium]